MTRKTNDKLKTSKSYDDVVKPRRLSDDGAIGGTISDRQHRSTVESDELSSCGSLSSSSKSYQSDVLKSPERISRKLNKGLPPKPSPRPSIVLSPNEGGTGIINIEDLKERLSTSNKKNLKNKARRRASLSSHFSGTQGSSGGEPRSPIKLLNSSSADSVTDDTQSLNMGDLFVTLTIDDNVKIQDEAPTFRETNSKPRDNNMSGTSTLLVGNVVKSDREKRRKNQIKKDQIIESIVWFSFHIPRTVLEDLIAHELEIWKRNFGTASNESRRKSSRRHFKHVKRNKSSDGDNDSEVSVSSLSEDGGTPIRGGGVATHFTRGVVRREHSGISCGLSCDDRDSIRLPKAYERESVILFVDMSGFTKLSTLLDVESLSKVINSYFDLIVSEVILYGGDILKFAGDAFFAEWRIAEGADTNSDNEKTSNPLSELNASLVSINELNFDDFDMLPITRCVMMAAKCATSIVTKFSDYHVTAVDGHVTNEAMLNVHCGVGVGQVVGLHVRDCKDGEDEDAEEMRREFLLLGDPIDQVRF
jgi:class 3 adenylate cyclase